MGAKGHTYLIMALMAQNDVLLSVRLSSSKMDSFAVVFPDIRSSVIHTTF